MFTPFRLAALVLVGFVCAAGAQDKTKPAGVKVQLHLAGEHVPPGLKAGDRADVGYVASSVITKTGKAMYNVKAIAKGVEVASVTAQPRAFSCACKRRLTSCGDATVRNETYERPAFASPKSTIDAGS